MPSGVVSIVQWPGVSLTFSGGSLTDKRFSCESFPVPAGYTPYPKGAGTFVVVVFLICGLLSTGMVVLLECCSFLSGVYVTAKR